MAVPRHERWDHDHREEVCYRQKHFLWLSKPSCNPGFHPRQRVLEEVRESYKDALAHPDPVLDASGTYREGLTRGQGKTHADLRGWEMGVEWVLVGGQSGERIAEYQTKGGVREKPWERLRMGENNCLAGEGSGKRGLDSKSLPVTSVSQQSEDAPRRNEGVQRPGARPRAGRTLSESSSGSSWQQRRQRKDLGSRPRVCLVVTK